jgi:ribonuclease HII
LLKRYFQTGAAEAGCDEAGRGCYAGPVFAAAVILPQKFSHPLLNDSKQVSEVNRNELRVIIEAKALAWNVAWVDQDEIDRINILNASFKAMHLALDGLKTPDGLAMKPSLLLIDGNRFTPYREIPHHCIIKGDSIYTSIAAASILAKTWRDEYMQRLHLEFPHYRWDSNKGYGTAVHREAIAQFGICKYHRKSFNILPDSPREADPGNPLPSEEEVLL